MNGTVEPTSGSVEARKLCGLLMRRLHQLPPKKRSFTFLATKTAVVDPRRATVCSLIQSLATW